MIKKLLIFMAVTLSLTSVIAHNPNTTSVNLSPINGIWVAQFTISQEGANVALKKFYKDLNLQNLTLKEYKELYIKYIKEHTTLKVDGNEVLFSSAGIKLGNHQTNIKFILEDLPISFDNIFLKLAIFEENQDQNTVVTFKNEDKTFRKVLNNNNNFELQFENTESSYREYETTNFSLYVVISVGLIIFIFTGTFLYRKRNKNSP